MCMSERIPISDDESWTELVTCAMDVKRLGRFCELSDAATTSNARPAFQMALLSNILGLVGKQ